MHACVSESVSELVGGCGVIGCGQCISVYVSEVSVTGERVRVCACMCQWVSG